MPKVVPSSRRLRALQSQQQGHHPLHHGNANPATWLNAPRKVSFEDGHQSSSSFSNDVASAPTVSCGSMASSSAASFLTASSNSSTSRSSLRRKAPSVCLVGLGGEEADSAPPSSMDCLSPRPMDSQLSSTVAASSCSSPWGHFVDILVPTEERTTKSSAPNFVPSLSRRRRRHKAHPFHLTESPTTSIDSENGDFFGFFQPTSSGEEEEIQEEDRSYFKEPSSPQSPISFQRKKHRRIGSSSSSIPFPLSEASCSSSLHPYGLLPRNRRRRRRLCQRNSGNDQDCDLLGLATKSFLPGPFVAEGTIVAPSHHPSTISSAPVTATTTTTATEDPETQDVETALQRLKV